MAVSETYSTQLEGDVWQFLDEFAPSLVRAYYTPTSVRFSGRAFDSLDGGGAAPAVVDRFSAADIVAISMLSIDIPAEAALVLLDTKRWQPLLSEIRTDDAMWEVPVDEFGPASPASELWSRLCEVDGIGWVTAHKLCARKRPNLLPVYDQVVKAALQPSADAFWVPMWNELQSRELRHRLADIRKDAGVGEIALLRVLDVCIWMRNRGISVLRAATALPDGLDNLPFRPRPPV